MSVSRASELVPVLEQEIVTGALKPGTRLDETLLAERFGVSRTPVRETLTRLAAGGLVEIRPRRGAVVATITIKDLMDMFEVMANLEAVCARLAARRITPEEKKQLAASHAACSAFVETDQFDEYYEQHIILQHFDLMCLCTITLR